MYKLRVLNVGGGRTRNLPKNYDGWQQDLLDIDESVNPDIRCHTLNLIEEHPDRQEYYNAVFCSHNLEHYYLHEVPLVLGVFRQVLVDGGNVEICVPNVKDLIRTIADRSLDVHDVWYRVGDAPITFHDVLYGYGGEMRQGNLYYAHRCGFTPISMYGFMERAGFSDVMVIDEGMNIRAKGTKKCQQ